MFTQNARFILTIDSVDGNGCKSFGLGSFGKRSSGFTWTYSKQTKKTKYHQGHNSRILMNVHTSLTTFVADKQWLVPGVGMPHPHFSLSWAEI